MKCTYFYKHTACGKFWQINALKAFGEEKVGESARVSCAAYN